MYVCYNCGNEQDSMDRLCDNCNSKRVGLIEVIKDVFGDNWRKCFPIPYR
jgi:NMD protein affecting ribosome stability and mRNA decay